MGARTACRISFFFVVTLLAGAAAAVEAACITPPPEWVNPPPTRPTILDDQVQPPLNELLQTLPTQFLIPVSVEDPQEHFNYSIFVDYNAVTNPLPVASFRVAPATAVTIVPVDPRTLPLTPDSCHVIDFLVVHDFATLTDGAVLPHTPDSAGGDEITWFYLPGGSPNGCPGYDAGMPPGDGSPDGSGTP